MSRRILVVDDEQGVRAALGQLLEFEGYEVRSAAGADKALAAIGEWRPDLVFLDVKMAGMDGLEALKEIRHRDPAALVVMISGHATIQTAVEATQLGAYDILEKPLDTDRILVLLRNALEHRALREEVSTLRERIESRYEIVGTSFVIRSLLEQIETVGATPARVLISGENGTGKELVARALHRRSTRASEPFIEVNCAAIPGELIESELFGHMRGSFTGAVQDRPGKFEQADGGTLFLDEIGDMSVAAQAKVLRVLQDGEVTRIGGAKRLKIDVRVLAATNRPLAALVGEGRFRADLFYRLQVLTLSLPSLRERSDELPALASAFLPRGARLSAGALRAMERYAWPGNVRELKNTLWRAALLAEGAAIDAKHLGLPQSVPAAPAGPVTLDEAERRAIREALRFTAGNKVQAARVLGIARSTLLEKLKRLAAD